MLQIGLPRPQLVDLRLRHLSHLAVAVLVEDVTRLGDASENPPVVVELLDRLCEVSRGLGRPRVESGLTEHDRVGERTVQLTVALFDLAKLVKHRSSSGAGTDGTLARGHAPGKRTRCRLEARVASSRPYASAATFLLYFRWKRSTRPAVSMNFCLPVKKG